MLRHPAVGIVAQAPVQRRYFHLRRWLLSVSLLPTGLRRARALGIGAWLKNLECAR